jgi:replicative DNA helicase
MPLDDGYAPNLFMPPSNQAAEQALLGALLADNRGYDKVAASLRPEMFADQVNAAIYAAIGRRVEAGQVADAVTLKGELADVLGLAGGPAYLGDLLVAMVSISGIAEYGRAIRDCWVRREAMAIAAELGGAAAFERPDQDGEAVVTEAVEHLLALGEQASAGTSGPVTFAAALSGAVQRADAAHKGVRGAGRLDIGLPSVDALWGGLWPGQLYYLAARSRTGKSPFMAQIARAIAGRLLAEAEETGAKVSHVHLFSLEMTAEDLATVNLAGSTDWTADQIRSGDIGGDAQWLTLERARADLARLPIVIEDGSDLSISQLATRARVVRRTHRTRLVLVDYLELIARPPEHARMGLPEWIPFVGYRLKALAKALGVPIVALRQINKSRDDQESTRPTLRDLPYDGGQAADAVLALHRPELTMGDDPPLSLGGRSAEAMANREAQWRHLRAAARGVSEFGAIKRRFGPTGWVRMRFDGPRMLLCEREPAHEPPADLGGTEW